MVLDDLSQFLLESFPDARKVSGGKEVVLRCRFCGDSKDIKSKHLYISLGHNNKPPMFNCFKCGEQGILNSKRLKMLSLADSNTEYIGIGYMLDKYVSEIYSNPLAMKQISKNGIFRMNNTLITEGAISQAKLKYINNRLGLDFNYGDLLANKIVLNLGDLLDANNINQYTRHPDVMQELDSSFIGFISLDNGYVNLRNLRRGKVNKSIDTKYVNYNIFNCEDNGKRCYVLPTNINLNNPNPIRVHIAEGTFDILSVRYNLRKDMDNSHDIFAAICGKSYLNLLKLFIVDFGIMNMEIHLYMDNDIDNWIYEVVKTNMAPFGYNIFVHLNKSPGEKDFGVPLDRIDEYTYKL